MKGKDNTSTDTPPTPQPQTSQQGGDGSALKKSSVVSDMVSDKSRKRRKDGGRDDRSRRNDVQMKPITRPL